MTAAATALAALLDRTATDVEGERARLDGRAWGLAAGGCRDGGELLEQAEPEPARLQDATAVLSAHAVALTAGELPMPALPDADAELALRARVFGVWCAAVVDGLHSAALERLPALDADALEAYQDLAALAAAAAPDGAEEAAEVALSDVTEHARVALALIAASLNGPESVDEPG